MRLVVGFNHPQKLRPAAGVPQRLGAVLTHIIGVLGHRVKVEIVGVHQIGDQLCPIVQRLFKIAVGIDAGLLGYEMYQNNQQFFNGEGIVKGGVDQTIAAVARLGRDGMRDTDREILHIMIDR